MSLLEPFRHAFMTEALLVGCLVGAVCAVLSCYLVLKGWSLMGDAVSHAVLPGVGEVRTGFTGEHGWAACMTVRFGRPCQTSMEPRIPAPAITISPAFAFSRGASMRDWVVMGPCADQPRRIQ